MNLTRDRARSIGWALILTVCFIAGSCAGLAMLLFRICTLS